MNTALRDYLIYVGIATALVLGILCYAIYAARTGASGYALTKWLWVITTGAIVFGKGVSDTKKGCRTSRFLVVIFLYAAAHFVGFSILMSKFERAPILLAIPVMPLEYLLIRFTLEHVAKKKER